MGKAALWGLARMWICGLGGLLLLAGCSDERVLEKLGNVQTTSYDIREDGKLDIAVTIPKSDPETSDKREVLSTVAGSSKDAKIYLSRKTNLYLVSGQLRNTLFGLPIAKKGIWTHMDTLLRDPSIAPQVKVTIVDGKAKDVLIKDYKKHPRTGRYIDRMLEKEEIVKLIPKVSVYSFSRDYYDDGIDPVAPIIKDVRNDIIVEGIALFRDDRYVGKIKWKDAYIFTLLRGDSRQGEMSIDLGKGRNGQRQTVMFSSLVSSRKVSVGRDRFGRRNVTIHLKIRGSVIEYTGNSNISTPEGNKQLCRQISKYAVREGNRLVKQMQQVKADGIGIGKYMRNSMSYREWKKTDWRKQFPNVPVRLDIEVKLQNYGKLK